MTFLKSKYYRIFTGNITIPECRRKLSDKIRREGGDSGAGASAAFGSSAMSAYLCCVWQTRPSRAQTVPASARGHSRTTQASQFAPAPLPPPSLAHPVTTSGVVRHTTVSQALRHFVPSYIKLHSQPPSLFFFCLEEPALERV